MQDNFYLIRVFRSVSVINIVRQRLLDDGANAALSKDRVGHLANINYTKTKH